jgi:hypothetical protein
VPEDRCRNKLGRFPSRYCQWEKQHCKQLEQRRGCCGAAVAGNLPRRWFPFSSAPCESNIYTCHEQFLCAWKLTRSPSPLDVPAVFHVFLPVLLPKVVITSLAVAVICGTAAVFLHGQRAKYLQGSLPPPRNVNP